MTLPFFFVGPFLGLFYGFGSGLFLTFFWVFACAFRVPFWPWVLGAVLLFFRSGFLGVFLFVFSLLFGLFSVPFWSWVLGAVLLFFRSGFLGVFWFFSFFMKAILSFVDFLAIFCFFFLFIFALTFHTCQIAEKAFLSFLFSPFFLRCLFFPLSFLL